MRVPFFDLKAQYSTIRTDVRRAVEEVFESQQFILGRHVDELEEAVAAYIGVEHAIGMSSGTDALLATLMALGVGRGDLVLTPVFSFFATAGVVTRLGATPVFLDIDPGNYALHPDELKRRISDLSPEQRRRTRAIIPVHLYGQCAEMAPILEVAEQAGIPVIEDSAQSIGAQYRDGRCAGSIGLAGCLSFFPTKNLGGAGDGGMVLTRDPDLAARLRSLRVHGAERQYEHTLIGGNFRLDSLQAAVLKVKLDHLEQWTKARQAHADAYMKLFTEYGLADQGLLSLPETRYRAAGVSRYHVFHQFVIRVRDRDRLRTHLHEAGIGTEVYYRLPFHLQPCFRDLGYTRGDFPNAERAAREAVALPVYPELTQDQQAYVVDRIASFLTPSMRISRPA